MSNSKKILFVHHHPALGGAELSFFDLVTNLSDDIIPVCAVPEGPLLHKLTEAKIKTYSVSMQRIHRSINPFYLLGTYIKRKNIASEIKEICHSEGIDLIHANSLTAAIYAAQATDLLKIPLVWHERDLIHHPFLTPKVAKFATRIIAISQAVADSLKQQLGDSDKIRLIHNGIEVANFANPSAAGIPVLPKEGKTVLMAAQFVRWKGHIGFIEVASLVKKEISDTFFILTGDKAVKDQQKYIRELENKIIEKRLEGSFIWTGFIENMPGLLHNIDCVVLPAEHEPFGRIVAEAMAAGKPVVAVHSGGVPEIIENGISGYLVAPGDCQGMAERVCKILKDDESADQMGKNARLRISQNFTIQRTVAEFEKLIKEISGQPSGPTS